MIYYNRMDNAIKSKNQKKIIIIISIIEFIILVAAIYESVQINSEHSAMDEFIQQIRKSLFKLPPLFVKSLPFFVCFTLIPSILSVVGSSFPDLLLKTCDIKNRRTIEQVLVDNERLIAFNIAKLYINLVFELCVYYLCFTMLFCIMQFYSYVHNNAISFVITILLIVFLCPTIASSFHKKDKKILFLLLCSIAFLAFYIATIIPFRYARFCLAICLSCVTYLFPILWNFFGVIKIDKPLIAKIVFVTRYMFLTWLIFSTFFAPNALRIQIYAIRWSVFLFLEYLFILPALPRYLGEITIFTSNPSNLPKKYYNETKVKGKIIQYSGGRLKYTLADGTEVLIHDSEIVKLSYKRPLHFYEIIIRGFVDYKTLIVLNYDPEVKEYQSYKSLSKTWIGFNTIKNKEKNIDIYKSSDVNIIKYKKTTYV